MANTIEYKGYIGSIEYSPEDKCFFGKLEMIDDLVTFEASTAQELEDNFHNSVNDYLETCKALGREPQSRDNRRRGHHSSPADRSCRRP